jgi:hypothetical protein
MSTVDLATIEERVKMASLDQHRGYAQTAYAEVQQYRNTDYIPETDAAGYQVLREPVWNKGKPAKDFHVLYKLRKPGHTIFPTPSGVTNSAS